MRRTQIFSFCMTGLLICGAARIASAKAVAAGSSCTISKNVKLSAEPGGKASKSVKAGTELLVLESSGGWVLVDAGGASGYLPSKELSKSCGGAKSTKAKSEAKNEVKKVEKAPKVEKLEPEPKPKEEAVAKTKDKKAKGKAAEPPPAAPTEEAPLPLAQPQNYLQKPAAAQPSTTQHKMAILEMRAKGELRKEALKNLHAVVEQTIEATNAFSFVSAQDIVKQLKLAGADKKALECDEAGCLTELGGALGAEYMVTSSIVLASGTYVIQLQCFNVKSGKVEGRASREYKGDSKNLGEEVREAAKTMLNEALGSKVGYLLVEINEANAVIKIDGANVAESPTGPLSLPAGKHSVSVEKLGFTPITREVEIFEKSETPIRITLTSEDDGSRTRRSSMSTQRQLSFAAFAVGAAGLIGGGVLYKVAGSKQTELKKDIESYGNQTVRSTSQADDLKKRRSSLATLDMLTLLAGGVGVAAIATGVVLWVTGDSPRRVESRSFISETTLDLPTVVFAPGSIALISNF